MADPDHLNMLRQGVDAWNAWREREPSITPDLSGADLREAKLITADLSRSNLNWVKLSRANLFETNLSGASLFEANLNRANLAGAHLSVADLTNANLFEADLSGASLFRAHLSGASLSGANLFEAHLTGADLRGANLAGAHLTGANLTGADLAYASLVDADIRNADLSGCRIYGVSAWGLKLSDQTKQQNLIIARKDEPEITVDNIEVAQFIYLMLNNQKIREVIDTITSKVVLILGRFTDQRKPVLDALRDELRKRNYPPILFDFDKPTSRTALAPDFWTAG